MASMHSWPLEERPRERLRRKGAAALGDAELLALQLGTGTGGENAVDAARRILAAAGGVERLSRLGLGALEQLPGVGAVKAARIVAAFELGQRAVERRGDGSAPARFACSVDIFEAYRGRMSTLQQEVVLVLGLNAKNELVRELVVAQGSIDECLIGPREVFRPMIAEAAARVVVLHNHPSGDASPSPQDLAVTRRLAAVGDLVGIPLLDHLVFGRATFTSLRDMGVLAER
jgi:DNA repair protein RadC